MRSAAAAPSLTALRWRAWCQADKDVSGLLHFDHGLNQDGVNQARSLRDRWRKASEEKVRVQRRAAGVRGGDMTAIHRPPVSAWGCS
jgi:hypothetical protein